MVAMTLAIVLATSGQAHEKSAVARMDGVATRMAYDGQRGASRDERDLFSWLGAGRPARRGRHC